MTTTGRRPTPTTLKLLRGNPGHRPLNDREPQPEPKLPSPPSHLSPAARKEWKRTGRLLLRLGLVTEIDRTALALYAQAFARWQESEEALRKYGMVIKGPNGLPLQSPYLSIATRAMEQLQRSLTEFGMTPASRTRVHAVAEPSPEASGWDELDRMGN